MWITLLRRTPASSPQSECAGCCQQGHAGSKTLHQKNLPVLNWRRRITGVDLHNGHKTVVVVVFLITTVTSSWQSAQKWCIYLFTHFILNRHAMVRLLKTQKQNHAKMVRDATRDIRKDFGIWSTLWNIQLIGNNWHSAGSLGWPFPMLKYKYIFQTKKYTEAMLSNSTWKLL